MSGNELQRPEAQFKHLVSRMATQELVAKLGEEDGQRRAAQFAMAFRAAAAKTPQLYQCNAQSVAKAMALCLMSDLMPGGHHPEVWLIPKGGNLECWVAPHGYRKAARRAKVFLQEIPVWPGYEEQAEEQARKAALGEFALPPRVPGGKGLDELVGLYIVARHPDGQAQVEWLDVADVLKRKKAAGTQSIWNKWPVEMARKTALSFAFRRGLVPLEDPGIRAAVDADIQADLDTQAPQPATMSEAREALDAEWFGAEEENGDE